MIYKQGSYATWKSLNSLNFGNFWPRPGIPWKTGVFSLRPWKILNFFLVGYQSIEYFLFLSSFKIYISLFIKLFAIFSCCIVLWIASTVSENELLSFYSSCRDVEKSPSDPWRNLKTWKSLENPVINHRSFKQYSTLIRVKNKLPRLRGISISGNKPF